MEQQSSRQTGVADERSEKRTPVRHPAAARKPAGPASTLAALRESVTALDEAKESGDGTHVARRQRDRAVILALQSGYQLQTVAGVAGLTVRAISKVRRRERELAEREAATPDALDEFETILGQYRRHLELLADIAENSDNESARVGALRTGQDAILKIIELSQAMGRYPRYLGQADRERDFRLLFSEVGTWLRDELDEDAYSRFVERFVARPEVAALTAGKVAA